nr:hypothetical protein CFP56_24330 [Quercus suber]
MYTLPFRDRRESYTEDDEDDSFGFRSFSITFEQSRYTVQRWNRIPGEKKLDGSSLCGAGGEGSSCVPRFILLVGPMAPPSPIMSVSVIKQHYWHPPSQR